MVKVITLETCGFAGTYVIYNMPDFTISFLHLLGVPDRRIMTVTHPTVFRSAVYTTAICCDNLLEFKLVYQALRERLLAPVASHNPALAPRLWMHRGADARNPGRELVNAEEVFAILQRYGFQIVNMAELPVRAQIAAAHHARILSGPHGAGFVHSFFMPPKSSVVECFSPEFINSGILPICRMLDHKYSMVVHNNAYGAYPHGQRLYVDCLQLEVVVRGITDAPG